MSFPVTQPPAHSSVPQVVELTVLVTRCRPTSSFVAVALSANQETAMTSKCTTTSLYLQAFLLITNNFDSLAGVPPVGVKSFAPCWFPPNHTCLIVINIHAGYQSSPTASDAACSYNGTVYPDNGNPFEVPTNSASPSSGTALPSGTAVAPVYPTGNNVTAVAGPTGTGVTPPTGTGTGAPIFTGAAVANKAGGALAIVGFAAAAFL